MLPTWYINDSSDKAETNLNLLCTTQYSALFDLIEEARRTNYAHFMRSGHDSCKNKHTSNSHNARSTLSSKLGSTRVAVSAGIDDSVSLRSRVSFSRQFEVDALPTESMLDRGGGDPDFEGAKGDDEELPTSRDCCEFGSA